jgi:hypothetical protein
MFPEQQLLQKWCYSRAGIHVVLICGMSWVSGAAYGVPGQTVRHLVLCLRTRGVVPAAKEQWGTCGGDGTTGL